MTTLSQLGLIGIGHAQSIEGADVEPNTTNVWQWVFISHLEFANVIVN